VQTAARALRFVGARQVLMKDANEGRAGGLPAKPASRMPSN